MLDTLVTAALALLSFTSRNATVAEFYRRRSNPNLDKTALYSIALGNLKGFQIGDPAKDRLVELRTFDRGEREFRLLFAVERSSNVRLEQSEINEVLNSLRSTPATDPARADAH